MDREGREGEGRIKDSKEPQNGHDERKKELVVRDSGTLFIKVPCNPEGKSIN